MNIKKQTFYKFCKIDFEVKKSEKQLTMQELKPYGATSSGGAGAVKRCGSDSSYFDLMFNIKKTCFKMAPRVLRPHHFYGAPGSDFGLKFLCGSGVMLTYVGF
jgi:hypothetical protein